MSMLIRPMLMAALWIAMAMSSVAFARHGDGPALAWPANAVLAAFLLIELRDRHRYLLHIAVLSVVSFLFNLWASGMAAVATYFTISSLAEAVFAAWMIARLSPAERLFDSPGNIFRFALAAIVACMPSALLIGTMVHIGFGIPWWAVAARWIATHGSALLIITPLILIVNTTIHMIRADRLRSEALWRGTAMFALVAATTTIAFNQNSYAIAFLTVPALLVATFHMRAPGAAGSVVIMAAIASWYTVEGTGPFSLMPVGVAERAYVLQLFISTMFLCALPLAAVLNQRDELAARTERHLASIRGIADRIGDVLFRIDEEDRWSYLNPAYEAVTGRSAADALQKSIFADLPERDHARVRQGLSRLRAGSIAQFGFNTQIVDAVGTTRHLEFNLHLGTFSGEGSDISGVFRDATARVLLDMQLRSSANSARQDARTDQLTRLPNRRAFFEWLDQCVAADASVAVAVFDIDHFKRINDNYGHPAGDEVLRRIAAAASATLRDGDLIARIGGEEFAVVLDNADPEAARKAAERVIAAIARQDIVLPGALTGMQDDIRLQVTVSMGLARLQASHSSAGLVAAADRALYAAKDGGRNQLKLAA